MLNLLKKFLLNEWKGIKQIADSLLHLMNPHNSFEEINESSYPRQNEIIREISNITRVYPKEVDLMKTSYDTNGKAFLKEYEVGIDRGNLRNERAFAGIYAHELGHLKYAKLHSHLNLSYLATPYNLLASATTTMYSIGLSAHMFMGNNKVLDGANSLFEHTGKYLIAATVINTILIRTREHMADLFSYNHTGILPSERVINDRNGIIGNFSKSVSKAIDIVQSGYPTRFERDIVCKILGNKKQGKSFVEKLKLEKTPIKNEEIHTFLR